MVGIESFLQDRDLPSGITPEQHQTYELESSMDESVYLRHEI